MLRPFQDHHDSLSRNTSPMTQQAASKTSNADCTRHCLRYLSTLCLFIVALLTTTAQAHAAQTQQPGITQSPISENSIAVLPPRQASQYDAPQSDNPRLLQRHTTPSRPPPPARSAGGIDTTRHSIVAHRKPPARVRVRRGTARGSDHEVQLRHVTAPSLAAPRRGGGSKAQHYQKDAESHRNDARQHRHPSTKDQLRRQLHLRCFASPRPDSDCGVRYGFQRRKVVYLRFQRQPNRLGDFAIHQNRQITWDEENRVQEISDNGSTTEFKYDDSGERVIKRSAQGETAYVNQFFTVRNRTSGHQARLHRRKPHGKHRRQRRRARSDNEYVNGVNIIVQ